MAWELLVILAGAAVGLVGSIWTIVTGFKTSTAWGAALLLSYLGAFLVVLLPLLGLIFPLIWLIIFAIFSVRYWRDVKVPALIVIVSLVAQGVAGYYFTANSQSLLRTAQQRLQSGEMDRAELRAFLYKDVLKKGLGPDQKLREDEPVKLPEAMEEQAMDQLEAQEAQTSVAMDEQDASVEMAEQETSTAKDERGRGEDVTQAQSGEEVSSQTTVQESVEPLIKPDPLEIKPPETPAPVTRPVSLSRAAQYIGEYFIVEDNSGVLHEGRLRAVEKGRLEFERKVYNGIFSFQLPQGYVKHLRLVLDVPKEPG